MNAIPRNEHPRPDRKRDAWLNLNGTWEFEIDNAKVGLEKKFYERGSLDGKITVPFCPESRLSGIAHTDFMYGVWYRRDIEIPAEWKEKRILLHFEACDYFTRVFVNGKLAGSHKGGYTPFSFDITELLSDSGNYITVYAEDDPTGEHQVAGKQSHRFLSRLRECKPR
jgi:beta-galactosidase/beta-glucuronidase